MNKLSREAIFNIMQTKNKTICEYCGAEKEGLSFVIGASKEPEWVLIGGLVKCAVLSAGKKPEKRGRK